MSIAAKLAGRSLEYQSKLPPYLWLEVKSSDRLFGKYSLTEYHYKIRDAHTKEVLVSCGCDAASAAEGSTA